MQLSRAQTTLIVSGIILAAGVAEYLMGHPLICKCGYVKLWHFDVQSAENSQHLIDWYTPSHIIHGFIFYWLLWLASRRVPMSIGLRLVLAVAVEASWEVIENTDFVINHYREMTISLDYYGDSVINSMSDILFMVVGFFLASWMPVWLTVLIAVALELFVGAMIRDNLTLNILMFVWPLELGAALAAEQVSRHPSTSRVSDLDLYAEHHPQDEPEIDHDGRIEGDAEAERAEIGIRVIAHPKQEAPDQEQRGEDDQRTRLLGRTVQSKPGVADEIEDELLEGVEDEAGVDVERRVGLGRTPDPHIGIEPLRGHDADRHQRRQAGEHGVLDHLGDAVAERPIGWNPMPEQLGAGEEGGGEQPVADQRIDEGQLARGEAEALNARIAPGLRPALR